MTSTVRKFKIQDSVTASFKKGDDDDEAQKFAEAIRESWREQATAFNRSVLLMLGLVALFVLSVNGTQFTFLGVTLKDTKWLQISIPTLVAYQYLDAVITACRWGYYETAHRTVVAIINPTLVDTGLDSLMGPRSLSVAGAGVIPEKLRKSLPYGRVTELALALMGLVAMGLVPVGFQIVAYYQLISRYKSQGNILPWIILGLGLTSILMLCSLFIWVTSYGWEHLKGIHQDFKSIIHQGDGSDS
jgi:hypothetical protein